ncbi:MAG: tetratricopeptide repeat protein, partial [Acidobacteriota bacterium]
LRRDGDFSLDDLLEADTQSSAYHDPSEVGRFYALSWALVHYLLSGGEEEIDRAVDYFVRLLEGEAPDGAFEDAFGRSLSGMEEELRTYLDTGNFATTVVRLPAFDTSRITVRRSAPADTLYHLGDLAAHLRMTDSAEAHFQAALDASPQHADTHAGLALVRNIQERWQEAEILYRDAVRLRAQRPLSYLLYGRHSLVGAQRTTGEEASARAERARAALDTAIRLSPDFGEAHALLAAAEMQDGGDAESALSSVRRARELLPSRLDLVELTIKVHLKRQDVEAAQRTLLRELEPRTQDLDQVNRAWEDIERTELLIGAEKAFEKGELEAGLELFDRAVDLTTEPALRQRLETELLRLQERVEERKSSARAGGSGER